MQSFPQCEWSTDDGRAWKGWVLCNLSRNLSRGSDVEGHSGTLAGAATPKMEKPIYVAYKWTEGSTEGWTGQWPDTPVATG